ncbi:elongation factor G [Dunaliella salina]|uniref:Elongation factor G n=1 Tax=Dunaliella salina TaxID=3046 RepID=A0ABQ7GG28_DUNSA|nr:elongation factor G [Dunaliella salina]|eukprot:KAF5833559.1 elongation factor G [Dunaliella salina]
MLCVRSLCRQAYKDAQPYILEPVMHVEITVPAEFQGTAMGDLNRRKGMILDASTNGDDAVISAQVPLNSMFGYSTVLRSNTQGKGEFSMEYSHHAQVTRDLQDQLTSNYSATSKASA